MAFLNTGKNLIIGGAFDYWQRGANFTSAASGIYCADRFSYHKSGTMVHNISRDTDVPTLEELGTVVPYSLALTLTTPQDSLGAGHYCLLIHKIEGAVLSSVAGKTMTLSFWVKSSVPGVRSVAFRSEGFSRCLIRGFTIHEADTWEKKVLTIKHDPAGTWNYGTGTGMEVCFVLASGTTGTTSEENVWHSSSLHALSTQDNGVETGSGSFKIAAVMLEPSEQPSNFERSGGDVIRELQLCQRYYEKTYNIDVVPGSSTIAGASYYRAPTALGSVGMLREEFKVLKRANPDVSIYSTSGEKNTLRNSTQNSNKTASASSVGESGFITYHSHPAAQSNAYDSLTWHWIADAEL